MSTAKCRAKTWVNRYPPNRELDLELEEARRLAKLGYLAIIEEYPDCSDTSPEEAKPEGEVEPAPEDEPLETPAETPAPEDEPLETPAETPAPEDEPLETPAETPAPEDEPLETPAETPAPEDAPLGIPAETPVSAKRKKTAAKQEGDDGSADSGSRE